MGNGIQEQYISLSTKSIKYSIRSDQGKDHYVQQDVYTRSLKNLSNCIFALIKYHKDLLQYI